MGLTISVSIGIQTITGRYIRRWVIWVHFQMLRVKDDDGRVQELRWDEETDSRDPLPLVAFYGR